ncbi:hypothetical protein SAMN05421756_101386 [Microlunatus flavus]|uniref:Glycosyl-4,4'-diaponeurosporenoate acyltransferase n=2 Tax=Microlunatus flavus TaxID=1036181 RepID=A0A1H8ZWV8_9ACTN|nr:hypothetical protein SAMN05421756_101386 [Microlunatus flavus]
MREVLVLVVGCAVVLVVSLWLPPGEFLWDVSPSLRHASLALMVVGLLLILAGNVRSSTKGHDRTLVGPDAYLPKSERTWFREQITHGRAVPADRRYVVIALADRMRGEGVQALAYVGTLCFYVGMLVGLPLPSTVLAFTVLMVWMTVRLVRALVWSHRSGRWLAQHA